MEACMRDYYNKVLSSITPGAMLGSEARGLHNGFVHAPGGHDSAAAQSCNGCGITLYAPNLNLVRDPRWGRAQVGRARRRRRPPSAPPTGRRR